MKLEFSRQIFEKYSDIKFYWEPNCSTQMDGQADDTKSLFTIL